MAFFRSRPLYRDSDGGYYFGRATGKKFPSFGAYRNYSRSYDKDVRSYNSRFVRTVLISIVPILLIVFLVIKINPVKSSVT